MFTYIWPLLLIILSNILYQICAKEIPEEMNTYASMSVTYAVATIFSLLAFFVSSKGSIESDSSSRDNFAIPSLFKAFSHTNWATVVLGLVITGLEVGFIFAYKNGWKVSTLATVSNSFLALALIFVGLVGYNEPVNWSKILGVVICLVGLYFINKK